MDRKKFLITIWQKGVKPILIIGIIMFCLKLLYNVFTESGTERFLTILTIGLGLLVLTSHLIGQLFKSTIDKINLRIPKSIRLWIRVIRKFLNYIAPIIFGMIIYHFWREDWIAVAIVLGVLLIQQVAEIIKEEKQALTKNKNYS